MQDACQHIQHTTRNLTHSTDLTQLQAAVESVHRITGALTELVDVLTDRARVTFRSNDHSDVGNELLHDLRAARGCLTTAGLLIAPAVDDFHQLAKEAVPAAPRARRIDPYHAFVDPPAVAVIDRDAAPRASGLTPPTQPAPDQSP